MTNSPKLSPISIICLGNRVNGCLKCLISKLFKDYQDLRSYRHHTWYWKSFGISSPYFSFLIGVFPGLMICHCLRNVNKESGKSHDTPEAEPSRWKSNGLYANQLAVANTKQTLENIDHPMTAISISAKLAWTHISLHVLPVELE